MRTDRPLLTAQQEIELARRVHGPDPADSIRARDELVLSNFGLAGSVVKHVMRRRTGRDYDDLFSEAMVALVTAAERYNPDTRPARFSSYAVPAIRNRLRHYTDAETLVRVPNYVQDSESVARMMERKARPTSRRKLRDNVRDAKAARRPMLSLSFAPVAEPECSPADPRPEPLEAMVRHEDFMNMLDVINQLDPINTCCHVITRIMSNNALDFG